MIILFFICSAQKSQGYSTRRGTKPTWVDSTYMNKQQNKTNKQTKKEEKDNIKTRKQISWMIKKGKTFYQKP